ncbi:MAG: RIP metalloprotease RseP [Carboxydocellales bacterium]
MLYILSTIVVLGLLVFIHELGHFAVAKAVGVKVYEFSIGFGPKLFGFNSRETRYNIRIVPLGGFVRMAGMDQKDDEAEAVEGQEEEALDPKRSFANKSVLQRMAVIVAGPIMNFILASLLISTIFIVSGIPELTTKIGDVLQGEPAAVAGLKAGDKILAINKQPISNWEDIVTKIHQSPKKTLEISVERAGKSLVLTVPTKQDVSSGAGFIGIKPAEPQVVHKGILPSLGLGAVYTVKVTGLITNFVGQMITKKQPAEQLGGPVRIAVEIGKAAELGLMNVMQIAAILSINLGLFNLFPIPALDGSRLLFLLWEALRGKPVDPAKENMVHLVGFAMLLLLMVFVTFNDISQLIKQ